jgi:hypothetical protein
MFNQPAQLPMPQILSADASLLSPVPAEPATLHTDETAALQMPDFFAYKHYPSYAALYAPTPDAPGPLRLRASPDLAASQEEPSACISPEQVFDLCGESMPATPEPIMHQAEDYLSTGAKRASPEASAPSKKPRPAGERITTKTFVPPDVTGLSKREARLVKNR